MSEEKVELPAGWCETNLEGVADVVTGNTPSKKKAEYYNGSIPFFKPGDLDKTSIIYKSVDTVSRLGAEAGRLLPKETILVSCIGNLGKTAIIGTEGICNQQINALIPTNIINFKYLYHWCNTLKPWMVSNSSATTVSILNKGRFSKAPVILPPLNEQRRIVAKIEALQARSRAAKEALDAITRLERLAVDRYTSGWPEQRLGGLIQDVTTAVGSEWKNYKSVGLSNSGIITNRKEKIGIKTAQKCRLVQTGDIVFNPIRFSIGSIARYRGSAPVIVSPEYRVIRTCGDLSSELLVRFLRTPFGRSLLDIQTTGSVRYRVYFKHLCEIVMPIAPPVVQKQAEKFFSTLNTLNPMRVEMNKAIETLNQAILAKAFRGELVPQDPSDEPATVLLERIRAEREALEAQKKAKKKSTRKRRKGAK